MLYVILTPSVLHGWLTSLSNHRLWEAQRARQQVIFYMSHLLLHPDTPDTNATSASKVEALRQQISPSVALKRPSLRPDLAQAPLATHNPPSPQTTCVCSHLLRTRNAVLERCGANGLLMGGSRGPVHEAEELVASSGAIRQRREGKQLLGHQLSSPQLQASEKCAKGTEANGILVTGFIRAASSRWPEAETKSATEAGVGASGDSNLRGSGRRTSRFRLPLPGRLPSIPSLLVQTPSNGRPDQSGSVPYQAGGHEPY
ncbi:unnamed protein product [Protopolystoma xenopodis]|uniref:Uncharacterized protein n=1 Tax=Protopolystoma xenopodis TaxID=117903 RepID=A0A3S5B5Z7_9PLAT|nr:unnamed protein product [Protopolystoma xenopodis]